MHHHYEVRTTVDVADHLLTQAKQLAASRKTSLTGIIEDSLRKYLADARQDRKAAEKGFELPTVQGSRLLKGVDLDDTSALLDDA
jgi:hypothetical protein